MNFIRPLGTFIIILFLSLSACTRGIPKEVIPPAKMASVLADIHIVDGYLSTLNTADTIKKVSARYYDAVYKKYNTDSAAYNRSLAYYYKNPKILDELYTKITKNLEKQKARVDSLSQNIIEADVLPLSQAEKSAAKALPLVDDSVEAQTKGAKKINNLRKFKRPAEVPMSQ